MKRGTKTCFHAFHARLFSLQSVSVERGRDQVLCSPVPGPENQYRAEAGALAGRSGSDCVCIWVFWGFDVLDPGLIASVFCILCSGRSARGVGFHGGYGLRFGIP